MDERWWGCRRCFARETEGEGERSGESDDSGEGSWQPGRDAESWCSDERDGRSCSNEWANIFSTRGVCSCLTNPVNAHHYAASFNARSLDQRFRELVG